MAVDINSTLMILEPITKQMNAITTLVSSVIGGLVGLTIIMIVLRAYEVRNLREFTKEIRHNLRNIENRLETIEKKLARRNK